MFYFPFCEHLHSLQPQNHTKEDQTTKYFESVLGNFAIIFFINHKKSFKNVEHKYFYTCKSFSLLTTILPKLFLILDNLHTFFRDLKCPFKCRREFYYRKQRKINLIGLFIEVSVQRVKLYWQIKGLNRQLLSLLSSQNVKELKLSS